jgi:hypothetical protein
VVRTVLCDEGDGLPAMVMVSNLDSGDVVAICAEHWPAWIRALADALPPGPQEMPPAEAVTAQDGAGEAEAAPDTARTKRGRQRRESGAAALAAPESPFPDATPVE